MSGRTYSDKFVHSLTVELLTATIRLQHPVTVLRGYAFQKNVYSLCHIPRSILLRIFYTSDVDHLVQLIRHADMGVTEPIKRQSEPHALARGCDFFPSDFLTRIW